MHKFYWNLKIPKHPEYMHFQIIARPALAKTTIQGYGSMIFGHGIFNGVLRCGS